MKIRVCFILFLLLVCLGHRYCRAQETVASAAGGSEDLARQLRIYKDALLHGSNEQSRIDAAVELLRRSDRQSRAVLLEVLASRENPPARQAVCGGLSKSRVWAQPLRSRKDFLEPLLGMLIDEQGLDAELAAKALMIFEYREVSGRLKKLVRSNEIDRRVRLNVIYALKLRTDKKAISELVNLLDDSDKEVAEAAKEALPYWISVDADRRKILQDLERKSTNEIIRDRMRFQEEQIRRLEKERDTYLALYVSALDKEYESADEPVRGAMLVEKLGGEFARIKLWALGKILSYSGEMPEDFRDQIIGMVSDEDRRVRLETARVLTRMAKLNPAESLLGQFKVESYDDVRLAIFEALGEACYYAFSAGSEIDIGTQIRDETLKLAGAYLDDENSEIAKKGAEVIRKLLELNGQGKVKAEEYLGKVKARYERAVGSNGVLRSELLYVMARLCGQGSSRALAGKLFEKAFVAGLGVSDDAAVREASVAGLSNIDKVAAFSVFKNRGLIDDSSIAVRKAVMELAGEVGEGDELEWLVKRLGANGESDSAWKGVAGILGRSRAAVVFEWSQKLGDAGNDKFVTALLEMAENKAVSEKKDDVLGSVRGKLVELYEGKGDNEHVIVYCRKLLEAGGDGQDAESIGLKLFSAYLFNGNAAEAGKMVSARLAEKKDLDGGDVFVVRIEGYVNSQEAAIEAKAGLVGVLAGIKTAGEVESKWSQLVKGWQEKVGAKEEEPADAKVE